MIVQNKKPKAGEKYFEDTLKNMINHLALHSPYQLIQMERIKQDVKWGEQNHDDFKWLAILGEEFGEVSKAVCEQLQSKFHPLALRENLEIELVQIAAVCIQWIECLRRRDKQ